MNGLPEAFEHAGRINELLTPLEKFAAVGGDEVLSVHLAVARQAAVAAGEHLARLLELDRGDAA